MKPEATKLARSPKGVDFPYRAIAEAECTTTFIKLRGIDLRGEFDVAQGKHMESGWQMVRRAMCDKVGVLAPWFVTGGDDFKKFCDGHNIDADAYLEEVLKGKATEKWKYLQDVFKEKKGGTITVVDDSGKVVKKEAKCKGETQLDKVQWQFFYTMQQAMPHRALVCPSPQIIPETCRPSTKYVSCTDKPSQVCMDGKSQDSPCKVYENSPTATTDSNDYNKKKSTRPNEASSPVCKAAPLLPKGKRPSNANRRHEQVVSNMMEQSGTGQETVTHVTKSITDLQAKLQTNDREALILDRAMKIQRSWDERFAFLAAHSIPIEVITSYIGPKPTADEAIQRVMSLREALRKNS
eukprot:scaffold1_cov375-Pavlova_lutheri.AAC.45